MFLLADIAAVNYLHVSVKYFPMKFPSRGACEVFYEIMLRMINIASEEFTAYVQQLVVRPSPPRSLGSAFARQRSPLCPVRRALAPRSRSESHSAALSLRSTLARPRSLSESHSAMLLLCRALAPPHSCLAALLQRVSLAR